MGSKTKENAKAVSFAVVSLDFEPAGVKRRTKCTKRSVHGHAAISIGKRDQQPFVALQHIQATLYLMRSEMWSQCSSGLAVTFKMNRGEKTANVPQNSPWLVSTIFRFKRQEE